MNNEKLAGQELFEAWATKNGTYDLRPYNIRIKSVGGVPYDGYVRPYLQDRTVHAYEGFCAAIAAQPARGVSGMMRSSIC